MGCGISSNHATPALMPDMTKSEATLKAVILIQAWYRRYRARLEARRRCTWSIFQSIEYAGELNQVKLYSFFNEMITHLSPDAHATSKLATAFNKADSYAISNPNLQNGSAVPASYPHIDMEDEELYMSCNPDEIIVENSYKGPQLTFPITATQVQNLMKCFKHKQKLHVKYLLQVLHEFRKKQKVLENIRHASTSISKQITIVGDLHGKLDDLLVIFYKNGLPAVDNPYVFNGDFVDRGPNSIEVSVLLFCSFLLSPNGVYVNRGNHEDHTMNIRYGFVKEIMHKYKNHARKVTKMFDAVFSWLPLVTIVDEKILIVHGGVADTTDLRALAKIERHKFVSVLNPPMLDSETEEVRDKRPDLLITNTKTEQIFEDWKQMLDLLWSDPKASPGCSPNIYRGGGSYFGPDVTQAVLRRNKCQLLIRSHECKLDGYEYTHDGKVITLFSASNYYEIGSNKGAYMKLHGPNLDRHIVQYMSAKAKRRSTQHERIGVVEASALRSLKDKIAASKSPLLEEFKFYDKKGTGLISINAWSDAMDKILGMDLPWRILRVKICKANTNGEVLYETTFDQLTIHHKFTESGPTMTEALYRNKENLETIFRIMDRDNSGHISMEEFEEACTLLSKHMNMPAKKEEIADMARSIDINKDGFIDFNEFLEAFRLVDMQGKEVAATRHVSVGSLQLTSPQHFQDDYSMYNVKLE